VVAHHHTLDHLFREDVGESKDEHNFEGRRGGLWREVVWAAVPAKVEAGVDVSKGYEGEEAAAEEG